MRSIYTQTEQRRHCARRYRAFRTRSPPAKSGSVERTCIFDEMKRRYKPEGVDQAQSELYRKVGRIQLPTLLLELDSQVHFS